MKILIIDINGIGYASMYVPAFAKLTHNGEPTGAIHGTVNSVLNICNEISDAIPIVLWDGHSEWRRELNPDYKTNRTDDPKKIATKEAYKKQVPHIKSLLESYGICQIEHGSAEADDLAGLLVRNIPEDVEIILVSDDTDWWQSLRNNVTWYAPRNERILTLENLSNPELCSEGPFADTEEYIKAKAMAGDSSDNIEGIPSVGLKTAVKIMKTFGSIEKLWELHDNGQPIKGEAAKKVAGPEYRETYRRNLKLIDWRLAPDLDASSLKIKATPRDMDKFNSIAEGLGLKKVTYVGRDCAGNVVPITEATDVLDRIRHVFSEGTGVIRGTIPSVSASAASPESTPPAVPAPKQDAPVPVSISAPTPTQPAQGQTGDLFGGSEPAPEQKSAKTSMGETGDSSKKASLGNELGAQPANFQSVKRKFPF